MAEFQARQEEEARLREEEAKKSGKPPGKAPAPAKKGAKADDKPQLDVPKLEIPEIKEFEAVSGNKYVRERSFEEIANTLLDPPKEDEENEAEGGEAAKDAEQEPAPEAKPEANSPPA
jgi:hypothetical protein